MASARKKQTKDGRVFYEIRASRGRGKPPLSTRWYPEMGWSKTYTERQLEKEKAEFEWKVKNGEVQSRREQAAAEEAVAAERARAEVAAAEEEAKNKTVNQYATRVFMPALKIRCAENTRSSYQTNFDNWILPAIGSLKLTEVTAGQINALLLSMQAQGKSQSTCVKVYTVLKGLFKSAYLDDEIEKNPMDKVMRPRPRKDEVQHAVESYSVEEVQKLLDVLEHEPLKWRAYLRLLIDTGIRRGEGCGLQWDDIDVHACTITIRRNLCYTKERGVYIDTPKNGHTRTIDVDPSVISLLLTLRDSQPVPSKYVFAQDDGKPIHPQSPTRYMATLAKRCGIGHLNPHKLRHTFASIAITHGADVASVSEKLGHSNKAVTLNMYTHANQESMKQASDIFRNAIMQKE